MSVMKLEQLERKFDEMPVRDQNLLFAIVVAGIIFIGFYFVFKPGIAGINKTKGLIVAHQSDIRNVEQETQMIQAKLKIDPDATTKAEIKKLKYAINVTDASLTRKIKGLVSAKDMIHFMESVLVKSAKLKLKQVESLPSTPLLADIDTGYYKHPVRFQFVGHYFDLINYLKEIEGLHQKYYWSSLDYAVGDYPLAAITLNVYTLGSSRAFIGGKATIVGGISSEQVDKAINGSATMNNHKVNSTRGVKSVK